MSKGDRGVWKRWKDNGKWRNYIGLHQLKQAHVNPIVVLTWKNTNGVW